MSGTRKRKLPQKSAFVFLVYDCGLSGYDATRLLGKIQKRGWVLMSKRHLVLLSRGINRKVGIIIKLMELQAQKPSAVQEYRQRKHRNRRKS